MTLLQKLQTALNSIYGNTLTMDEDRGYDEYWCDIGKHRVYEDEFNSKQGVCFKCFYKEE